MLEDEEGGDDGFGGEQEDERDMYSANKRKESIGSSGYHVSHSQTSYYPTYPDQSHAQQPQQMQQQHHSLHYGSTSTEYDSGLNVYRLQGQGSMNMMNMMSTERPQSQYSDSGSHQTNSSSAKDRRGLIPNGHLTNTIDMSNLDVIGSMVYMAHRQQNSYYSVSSGSGKEQSAAGVNSSGFKGMNLPSISNFSSGGGSYPNLPGETQQSRPSDRSHSRSNTQTNSNSVLQDEEDEEEEDDDDDDSDIEDAILNEVAKEANRALASGYSSNPANRLVSHSLSQYMAPTLNVMNTIPSSIVEIEAGDNDDDEDVLLAAQVVQSVAATVEEKATVNSNHSSRRPLSQSDSGRQLHLQQQNEYEADVIIALADSYSSYMVAGEAEDTNDASLSDIHNLLRSPEAPPEPAAGRFPSNGFDPILGTKAHPVNGQYLVQDPASQVAEDAAAEPENDDGDEGGGADNQSYQSFSSEREFAFLMAHGTEV